MININLFIIMGLTIFFIIFSIKKLNNKNMKTINYSEICKQILFYNNMWQWQKPNTLVIGHKSYRDLEEQLKNLFIKVIILISEKNKNNIKNSLLITESLKNTIIHHLSKIKLIEIAHTTEVKIIFIEGDHIHFSIKNKILNDDQETEDECVAINMKGNILLESLSNSYYKNKFSHLQNILETPQFIEKIHKKGDK